MKRKAQTALEYLVTYGWAILAIVIIAAVLWYFGVFNPSKWTGAKQCGGYASFTCLDYTNTGSSATIVFGNAVGRQLAMNLIENYSTDDTMDVYCRSSSGSTSIGANEQVTCTYNDTTFTSGTQVSMPVNFTDAQTGLTKVEVGFIKAQ
jgi:hypothetical protein